MKSNCGNFFPHLIRTQTTLKIGKNRFSRARQKLASVHGASVGFFLWESEPAEVEELRIFTCKEEGTKTNWKRKNLIVSAGDGDEFGCGAGWLQQIHRIQKSMTSKWSKGKKKKASRWTFSIPLHRLYGNFPPSDDDDVAGTNKKKNKSLSWHWTRF